MGKVLVAHAPAEILSQALARLTRVTSYTVISPGLLDRQLARAARDGCATTVEEMTLGACSVAVPVRRNGSVVAALGLVVPNLRKERPRLVAALAVAARDIGRQLDRP